MKLALVLSLAALCAPSLAQHDAIRRLDLTPSGAASGGFVYEPTITPDGEWIFFLGTAVDLMGAPPVVNNPGLPVGAEKFIYRCEVRTRTFEQVNLGSAGQALPSIESSLVPGDRISHSADGNLVVWTSWVDDPALGDTNGYNDVFLRDIAAGTTELISGAGGVSTGGASGTASISEDGRYVAFISSSDDLVPGLSGGLVVGTYISRRVFLHDRQAGTTSLVSEFNGGLEFDEAAFDVVLAPGGGKLVYSAAIGKMAFGFSTSNPGSIHVVDLPTNTRQTFGPYMTPRFLGASLDAERVSFFTFSTLAPGAPSGFGSVYALNTADGSHITASTNTQGQFGGSGPSDPMISRDGRYVMFATTEGDFFAPGKQVGERQMLVKDLETGLTTFASTSVKGAPGLSVSPLDRVYPGAGRTLSANGDTLVFASNYDNLPGNNLGGEASLYIYERRFGSRDLRIENLHAGQTAQIKATGLTPGAQLIVGVSLTSQGPLPSYWGPLDLGGPIFVLGTLADGNGEASIANMVHPALSGQPVFAKGLDLGANKPTTSFYGIVR